MKRRYLYVALFFLGFLFLGSAAMMGPPSHVPVAYAFAMLFMLPLAGHIGMNFYRGYASSNV